MLPGFHKRQNNASPNTKEVEDKDQATSEASTIDTISTLDNSIVVKIPKQVTM